MKNIILSFVFCALFLGSAYADLMRNVTWLPPIETNQWAFELEEGSNVFKIAEKHGHDFIGAIEHLPNIYVFKQRHSTIHGITHPHHNETKEILWAEKQIIRKLHARQVDVREPSDPLYGDQWHLHTAKGINYHVNVAGAWNQGLNGAGVRIAVVDDGYEYTHPELSANYAADSSYDFNYNDADPYPDSNGDNHGTSAAGAAGARDNGICGVGSAFRAQMSGIRLIAAGTTDTQEASALGYKWDKNHIFTNSWGPVDDGRRLEGPGRLATMTLEQATIQGRNGRGTIYIWAGGNGRSSGDNCNYDGWANSRFTISIGAIDSNGNQAWYSESCSMLVGVAPSSGGNYGVTTADLQGSRGFTSGDCRNNFGGTSAAAPIAAGVAALILQKNPELGWRDVQGVLIKSCKQHRPTDTDWVINGAGLPVSHKFGYGLIDATKAVNLASSWRNLGAQVSRSVTNSSTVNIPDTNGASKYTSIIAINDSFTIEHVTLRLVATHGRRGELAINLISPSRTVSRLQEPHSDSNNNMDWTFGSIMQWGENSRGSWTLEVIDTKTGVSGRVNSWTLNLYGH